MPCAPTLEHVRGGADDERRGLRQAIESLLREELGATGVHQLCVRCGSSDHGRPSVRVADGAAPHVSWSYADGLAAVAWTWVAPVGIDVEATDDVRHRADWTLREAVLKATGEGLTGRPAAAAATADGHVWTSSLALPTSYVGHLAVLGAHATPPEVSWRLVRPAGPAARAR